MAGKAIQRLFVHTITHGRLILYLASSENGAVRVCIRMGDPIDPRTFFASMFPDAKIDISGVQNLFLAQAVQCALAGTEPSNALPLDIKPTAFQWKAYKTISRIPYGQTWTYGQVARALGRPGATRAVGQAMRTNPLPLIFP